MSESPPDKTTPNKPPPDKNLLKGTLDLLVLEAVAAAPRQRSYGYEITQLVLHGTGEAIAVSEGSLYPALHRMERDGWLKADWGEAAGRRRKYYKLTAAGRKALAAKRSGWKAFTQAVGGLVQPPAAEGTT